MAGISEDVENLRVNRADFMNALEEVHPAFGVSEEELQQVIQNGIIHYNNEVKVTNAMTLCFTYSNMQYRNFFVPASYLLNKSALQSAHL